MKKKPPPPHPWMPASYTPPEMQGLPPARLWADLFDVEKPMRYYMGANTLPVTVPEPPPPPGPLPDWPLSLVSATPTGHVVAKVPYLPAEGYVKPDVLIVCFTPGTAPLTTPDAVLAAAGTMKAELPFPPSFGIGFDQNVPCDVPGPFAAGDYTVYVIGRVPDPA